MPSILALPVPLLFVSMVPCAAQRTPASRAESVTQKAGWCRDSVESRAIACSRGVARRSGDTLTIRLANGKLATFIEQGGELPGGYHYAGRIGARGFHIVRSEGFETPPTWLFVDPRDGRRISASDEPIYSPDGARFVTAAAPDWNNCTERDHPSMDVWRFTDSLPVLEWRLDPFSCRTGNGWGPTDPRWRGADTIDFSRNDEVSAGNSRTYRRRALVAVRSAAGWRVVTPQ
jgi:hypothetical protein